MLTKQEIEFLKSLGLKLDYDNIENWDMEWAEVEDRVGDELVMRGLDENYNPNRIGVICEAILDKLP